MEMLAALVQPPIGVEEAERQRNHCKKSRTDFPGVSVGIQIHKEDSKETGGECSVTLQTQAVSFALQPEFKQDEAED